MAVIPFISSFFARKVGLEAAATSGTNCRTQPRLRLLAWLTGYGPRTAAPASFNVIDTYKTQFAPSAFAGIEGRSAKYDGLSASRMAISSSVKGSFRVFPRHGDAGGSMDFAFQCRRFSAHWPCPAHPPLSHQAATRMPSPHQGTRGGLARQSPEFRSNNPCRRTGNGEP